MNLRGSWVSINSMPENHQAISFMSTSSPRAGAVGVEEVDAWSKEFRADSRNVLAMNAICNAEMISILRSRDLPLDTYHNYSDRLETEAKVTNQKASGRCWLFAAANVLRLDLIKRYNLEDFEFSQAYLMWCDKLEKSNWFLENILTTINEDIEGRLMQHLLSDPTQDGGQWDMAVNLIEKYGLMPKSVFAESAHSGKTAQMNWLLTVKLREYACKLRGMKSKGISVVDLQDEKKKMLGEIYRILCISLGEPPREFDWAFRNKDKKFTLLKGLTPISFYREHAKTNIKDMVSLIHDPRHEYHKLYTVQYLGNVIGGQPVLYINLPIDELKKKTIKTIKDGEAVWFGCDVGKFCGRQNGVMDLNQFDYKNAYGLEFGMDKADRLRHGESKMTHAMTITGVHIEEGKPIRWRIENSWGEDSGDKGYYCMTDAWFSEYVYQVVIDKKNLDDDQRKILEQTAIALPPWDPLGALA